MIYRQMPATWDPAFHKDFYLRWGKENAVICARARRAEYPAYRQLLSIKAVFSGSEDYFLDGRRVSVDADTFLIINGDRTYASCIESTKPVHSFSIFFDRALVSRCVAVLHDTPEALLDDPGRERLAEFSERLYRHDRLVSPVLRYIRNEIDAGMNDPLWLEEQLSLLFQRMLRLEFNVRRQQERLSALKPATRREIERRLALGVDFIHSHFREAVTLDRIAAAAQLSPCHCLRQFQSVYGCSPGKYLQRRRCMEAVRLIHTEPSWTLAMVAEHVGFGTRSTLFRRIRAELGVEPSSLRRGSPAGAAGTSLS